MTTNQEGRQAALRDSTSTAYGVAADWHALFDDAGISAGTFNERLLAWINSELSASYSNLVSAMQAYAEDAGYDSWEDMATLVLAMNGAETLLDGETQGLAFDFTDQSALIIDTGTPANNYDSTGIVSSGALVGPGGKLTYTSASNKLTRQSDGYYKYQAHNLVPVSAMYTSWTKQFSGDSVALSGNTDPRGTATYVLTCNGTSGVHALYYNNAVAHVAGATYTNSVVVKKGTLRYIQISEYITVNGNAWANFDLDTGLPTGTQGSQTTPTVTDIGNGYFLCAISYPAGVGTTGGGYIIGITSPTATRAPTTTASGTYEVGGFHIRRTPSNDDYIETAGAAKYALPLEYSATDGSCLGLLVEEARTNLAPYSTTFDSGSWSLFGSVSRGSTAADPSGLTNAVEITFSGGGEFYVFANPTAGTTVTISCWAKRNAGSDQTFRLKGVSTGAVNEWSGDFTATSEWQRFSYTFASSEGGNYSIGSDSVNSASAILVWGFQVEIGSFPTSLVQTFGAAATRAADNISIATSAFPYNQPEGSLYAGFISSVLSKRVFELSGGSAITRVADLYTSTSNTLAVYGYSATQAWSSTSTATWVQGSAAKVALAYKENDAAIVLNAGSAVLDTTFTPVPTATTLYIGKNNGSGAELNGHIKSISYVPRRKSNAELQAETT